MMARTMVINKALDETLLQEIEQEIPGWHVIATKNTDKIADELAEAEIILHWKQAIEPIILEQNKQLKWIQTWSAGVNSLPLEALEQKNVTLTSATGVHAYSISETIFAFMLGLTRKMNAYVRGQANKEWHHADLKLEIHNKTIGILGVGAIGQETAKIAKAFSMNVLGLRHSGKETAYVDEMYTPDQLATFLPECDYVVITLPLTEATEGMFNNEAFRLMKDSAILINIGRGPIVDEEALVQALEKGEIAGAGLDVFQVEPLPKESPLWEMENVMITPHTAGSTEHYDERVVRDIVIPNIRQYLKQGEPSVNVVDYHKGY
ncbi:D-2-hydroxyacid dehydrogenase [Gracilibacillus sp. S3-1-1]|uniref:D-2-hydroxyacid dehydrogenase n=1 Tax=Gracilibacillus pellucidus TaxID=3095368 RepID=A0ACC6M3H7_9BACI|nr:D-2-hydroxyacid dehydrogenase [Gracilibacillus sp. S3-1-1]MDX8045501.1 D-2-hydroxyacid dehydrogenase [Gracilibacillus sp. S3-1-1]